ncbi:MAG: hypothetical protein HFI33_13710 [Lachnospiraceae bacterium]|nr:hypothetical protein [Lachnospiraceae bacterium]
MHLYKRKKRGPIGRWAALLGIFLAAMLVLSVGSGQLEATADQEQTELLRQAINQAVVNCYAMEGRYPESLDYLKENYGIQINTEKYSVTYEIFADNIRPLVKVTRLGQAKDGDKS